MMHESKKYNMGMQTILWKNPGNSSWPDFLEWSYMYLHTGQIDTWHVLFWVRKTVIVNLNLEF